MRHNSDARSNAGEYVAAPEIAADVTGNELSRGVRDRLRTLSKATAESVSRHLVMVDRLLYEDPDLAYEHARAAAGSGSRVDVVREALGLAAYAKGSYGEALRELRTARRLSGGAGLVSVMADCERGLGRPERAIALVEETDVRQLDRAEIIELGIVVAGARLDLDQPEAALAYLDRLRPGTDVERGRVASIRADVLEVLERAEEAARMRALAQKLLADDELVQPTDNFITDLAEGDL